MAGRPKIVIFDGFGVWRGPIYWDLDQKTTKNADEVSGFLRVFFGLFRPVYTGNLRKNPVFGLKSVIFGQNLNFSLSAKFNRFFIILGGVVDGRERLG